MPGARAQEIQTGRASERVRVRMSARARVCTSVTGGAVDSGLEVLEVGMARGDELAVVQQRDVRAVVLYRGALEVEVERVLQNKVCRCYEVLVQRVTL